MVSLLVSLNPTQERETRRKHQGNPESGLSKPNKVATPTKSQTHFSTQLLPVQLHVHTRSPSAPPPWAALLRRSGSGTSAPRPISRGPFWGRLGKLATGFHRPLGFEASPWCMLATQRKTSDRCSPFFGLLTCCLKAHLKHVMVRHASNGPTEMMHVVGGGGVAHLGPGKDQGIRSLLHLFFFSMWSFS